MKSVKCPHCGLVNFAEANSCKRCLKDFKEFSPQELSNNKLTDEKTVKSIQSKQYAIYGVGGILSFALSFVSVDIIEDALLMALLFVGFPAIGMIISWFIASLVESRTLGDKKLNYRITYSQKAAVFTASLVCAYFVFNGGGIGYFLAPFLVLFVNGALYLYEFQMKKRTAA